MRIIYRAAPEETVRLLGGRIVTGWKSVTDPDVLQRLDGPARGQVWQADLKALGISDLQGINSPRSYQSDPGLELFYQNRPMTLARWPNEGFTAHRRRPDAIEKNAAGKDMRREGGSCTKGDGRRVGLTRPDGWVHGYWFHDWSDQRHPSPGVDSERHALRGQAARSFLRLPQGRWFYAFNLLPELDSPGEWYLDRERAMLYFWPPARRWLAGRPDIRPCR